MVRGCGVAAALAAAALTATAARGAPAALGGQPFALSVETAIHRVFPALVRIRVVVSVYQEGREVRQEASGSGVIVSADGYVVTNHHVAGRARRLSCTLSDRREVDATLVGTDPLADIAVLRLESLLRPVPGSGLWRLGGAAGGQSGAGHGEPAVALPVGDRGHRQQRRHVLPPVLLAPDLPARRRGRRLARPVDRPRRPDLSGQLGWPPGEPGRRGGGHQRDLPGAGRRHSGWAGAGGVGGA